MKDKHRLIEKAGRVTVLLGGTSAEREISLLGGTAVLRALERAGVAVTGIDSRDGMVKQLLDSRPDRVFNMLHGRGGEDGTVQGLLSCLKIPFTGSGVLGSALSMDKLKSKLIWGQMGLSTADFVVLTESCDWQSVIDKLGKVVVKPVNEGSSIGMSLAATADELEAAYQCAREFDALILAEKYIRGEEYTVAILNGKALPAIQLKTDHKFYDYDAKYIANDTQYICPVSLPAAALQELNALALAAFTALGCEAWGRVDVMRDTAGRFYLLEVNTVPGMTDHSLVPMAAKVAGIEFEDLLLEILFAKVTDQN